MLNITSSDRGGEVCYVGNDSIFSALVINLKWNAAMDAFACKSNIITKLVCLCDTPIFAREWCYRRLRRVMPRRIELLAHCADID